MTLTKYIFYVYVGQDNSLHSIVTRLADGTTKYFFQATGTKVGLENFFRSLTDDLAESYFPRANKKGNSDAVPFDNWAYLPQGHRADRAKAEELAAIEYTFYKLKHKV